MSHLHLVDGAVPFLWWILGYILTIGILMFAVTKIKKEELSKKIPFVGVISALMLITMSVPLGFLPFHLNLTVLVGILGGPWIGFVAVFIVNLILAMIGHGGITVVGLNTLVIGTEVIAGYFIFKAIIKHIKPITAAAVAVVITLLISTTLMASIVMLTNTGLEYALPHSEEVHESEHDVHDELHEHEELEEQLADIHIFVLSGWGAVIAILLTGIVLEALVTSLIIGFFMKVRPEMIIGNAELRMQN
ncbi:MAG: cobalt/nickel transport system permease protein [Clostridiales bacterium]|jgi:cobalt/nickel transport system permease protein|nr:cobalt/nickel transport system permease protein [Clostridiales bacterium]MDK2934440.1 cobalt/nickel transport system permease protein [Clostridiales bacterium]